MFFSKNRFIIMPSEGRFYKAAKPAVLNRLEASIFLRDMVPLRMLHSLEIIEIIFPPGLHFPRIACTSRLGRKHLLYGGQAQFTAPHPTRLLSRFPLIE